MSAALEPAIGAAGYWLAAAAYALLGVALLSRWRARMRGSLLLAAVAVTVVWAAVLAGTGLAEHSGARFLVLAEALRSGAWVAFVVRALAGAGGALPRRMRAAAYAVCGLFVGVGLLVAALSGSDAGALLVRAFVPIGLGVALLGFLVVEQAMRNTRATQEWRVKFLWLAVGGMFVYDFAFLSLALMYGGLDQDLWHARGYVSAALVPLIALGVARLREWRPQVLLAPNIALYTGSIVAAGVYLLLMSFAGYWLRSVGGSWGGVLQVVFLAAAVLALAVVLYSGSARAWLRVFAAKSFSPYKYDYRTEWLELTRQLASDPKGVPLAERTLDAFARLARASGGGVWLEADGELVPTAGRLAAPSALVEPAAGAFAQYLAQREWIVDLHAERQGRPTTPPVPVPEWLLGLHDAWLVVPLLHEGGLLGFIVLGEPLATHELTWEDLDLLRAAGRQAASYFALERAGRALSEAQQFAAFNRFGAFLMHDLSNLVAQQRLTLQNAAVHRTNPAFVDDMLETIRHAQERMGRLLEQLKAGSADGSARRLGLTGVVRDVARRCADRVPAPQAVVAAADVEVLVNGERLENALLHLLRNAQDATPADGSIRIALERADGQAVIRVEDSGHGMDAEFVRRRLFKAFDSTKGARGMGIGAFQVREFARLSGGSVQVRSAPGAGTTFTIRLPLASASEGG